MDFDLCASHLFHAVRASHLRLTFADPGHLVLAVAQGLRLMGVADVQTQALVVRSDLHYSDKGNPEGYWSFPGETRASFVSWNGGQKAWMNLREKRFFPLPVNLVEAALRETAERMGMLEEVKYLPQEKPGTWWTFQVMAQKSIHMPDQAVAYGNNAGIRFGDQKKIEEAAKNFAGYLAALRKQPGQGELLSVHPPMLPAMACGGGTNSSAPVEDLLRALPLHLALADAPPPPDAWTVLDAGDKTLAGLWVRAPVGEDNLIASGPWGARLLVLGGSQDTRERLALAHQAAMGARPPTSVPRRGARL